MTSFDRDRAFVLIQAQLHEYEAGRGFGVDELVEQLEGCVRTVEGVVLTVEEAQLAAAALHTHAHELRPMADYRAHIAEELVDSNVLADRLEAAS